ncbi:MAG: hypothetical protein L3J96_06815, partial [Thermoplasmata archaeon]|nr:hypothetical protein [Thermoplasmata archaeon]
MSGFESPLASRLRWAAAVPNLERYAAPFATGAGITIGGTVLGTVLEGLRLSGPEGLLVLGAGALAGTLTLWGSTRRPAAEAAPTPSRPAVPESIVCSRCSNSVPAHEWAEIVRRAWHTAGPGPRTSPTGFAALAEGTGDRLWGQGAVSPARRLPLELVGPAPEPVRFPPTPGAVVPFAVQKTALRVPNEAGLTLQGEFSALPPKTDLASTVSRVVPPDLVPTFQPSSEFPPTAGSDLTLVPGDYSEFEPDLSFDWITAEALHPIPPHLRKGKAPERSRGPSP